MKKVFYYIVFFSVGVSAAELECASLTSPLAGSNGAPTSTSIRWTSQPEAIGYEVTVGTSQFENDIVQQTIYTENFTEQLNLPPSTTIYVIIIPFSNTQFAVGCEFLIFTTSDCGYFVNPISEVSLCYSVDAQNELLVDLETVKTELVGPQENLSISYFDEKDNSIVLEALQPSAENNKFNILARVKDELNCTKEVEFILSYVEILEATNLDNVVACKSFVLPELNQGNAYFSENRELLTVGTAITESQTILVIAENSSCSDEKSFTITIDSNLCDTLEAGTDYPNYFTPNGDGINDVWNVQNSIKIDIVSISIHDRYGNLISQFSSNDVGWDGTFNGSPLPASDYWFIIDIGNNLLNGHFSLKR